MLAVARALATVAALGAPLRAEAFGGRDAVLLQTRTSMGSMSAAGLRHTEEPVPDYMAGDGDDLLGEMEAAAQADRQKTMYIASNGATDAQSNLTSFGNSANGTNSTNGTVANSSVGNGTEGTIVNSTNGTPNNSTDSTLVNSTNGTLANSTNGTIPNRTNGTIMNSTNGTMVNSTEDILANGTNGTLANGTEDTLANGTEDTLANGTNGTLANGTEDTLANGTNGTLANGTNGTTVNSTEDTLANGTNDTLANGTNGSNASSDSDATDVHSPTCVTRQDSRVTAMGYRTAEPGTPCIFGLDARDEGSHCVMDEGQYGSLGWCFTSESRSEWGACSEGCPLQGSMAALKRALEDDLEGIKKEIEAVRHLAEDALQGGHPGPSS